MSADGRLACPRCAATYGPEERFCADCGMPLVPTSGGSEPVAASHERARKVKPQYARGELVKVAWGRNQAEGELIQGLLLEEGIPSMLRRTRGFDVPDFLAAGPRDVLVPESGREAARSLLDDSEVPVAESALGERPGQAAPVRLLAGILAVLVAGLGLSLLLLQLTG